MDEKQQLIGSLPTTNDSFEQRAHAKKSSRWGTVKLVCRSKLHDFLLDQATDMCNRLQHAQPW